MATQAWGAGYVPWQPMYDLWMPAISANSSAAILTSPTQQLPFAEPTPTFAQAPIFKRVPFDPTGALIMDQKYFASDAPVLEKTTVVLKIPSYSSDKFRIEGLSAQTALPTHLIVVKTPAEVTVLGNWPAETLPQDREKLIAGAKAAVTDAPEGQYGAQVYFE